MEHTSSPPPVVGARRPRSSTPPTDCGERAGGDEWRASESPPPAKRQREDVGESEPERNSESRSPSPDSDMMYAPSGTQRERSCSPRHESQLEAENSQLEAEDSQLEAEKSQLEAEWDARPKVSLSPEPDFPTTVAEEDAVRLVRASQMATKHLRSIGTCHTKYEDLHAGIRLCHQGEWDTEEAAKHPPALHSIDDRHRDEDPRYNEIDEVTFKQRLERENYNAGIVKRLKEIHNKHINNCAMGQLEEPFRLRITRKGCEFNGAIEPFVDTRRSWEPPRKSGAEIEQRIKSWYANAAVSGYGDALAQVTKVDAGVRNAREIPAHEFSVGPELLERIAELWDAHFFPNAGVRVEPYKISLYGPGGHFKRHRDTPQQGLVGTFLLGLGDTTRGEFGKVLCVDDKAVVSREAEWCAFYPDLPHSVQEIASGYRAIISFKLFRLPGEPKETKTSLGIRQQVKTIMQDMRAPYGMLLERRYGFGTSEFSGFDSFLIACARAQPSIAVVHFPVVVEYHAEWGSENSDLDTFDVGCETSVYPFTRGHLDALAALAVGAAPRYLRFSHAQCGCAWLDKVKGVPFFSMDFTRSATHTGSGGEPEETVNYVGNEAQAWREDSVYFSYGLLVLPEGGASEETKGSSA